MITPASPSAKARLSPELGYPPYRRLARIVFSYSKADTAQRQAEFAADAPARDSAGAQSHGTSIIGPAPCFYARVDRQYRWHLLLRGPDPRAAACAISRRSPAGASTLIRCPCSKRRWRAKDWASALIMWTAAANRARMMRRSSGMMETAMWIIQICIASFWWYVGIHLLFRDTLVWNTSRRDSLGTGVLSRTIHIEMGTLQPRWRSHRARHRRLAFHHAALRHWRLWHRLGGAAAAIPACECYPS